MFYKKSESEGIGVELVTDLYNTYGKTMWKYAYKLSNDYEISNDVVSIAFVKIIEKLDLIKKIRKYKIKSYLLSIVKNSYINYKSKEKEHINYDDIQEVIADSRNNDFFQDKYTIVEETLDYMPEPYKSIIKFRYVYEELSYEEIAELLDISANSIRMYKKRAIDMLKERLQGGEIYEK